MKFCPGCGKEVGETWKICQSCGSRLKGIGGKPASPSKPEKKKGSNKKWIILIVLIVIVGGFFLLTLLGVGGYFLLSGSDGDESGTTTIPEEGIVCNPPYILFEGTCCLDRGANGICDKDEITTTTSQGDSTTVPLTTSSVEVTSTTVATSTIEETTSTLEITTSTPVGPAITSRGFSGVVPITDLARISDSGLDVQFENQEDVTIRPLLMYANERMSSQLCTPNGFQDEKIQPGDSIFISFRGCTDYKPGGLFSLNINFKYERENEGKEISSAGYIEGNYP
ncbi:MAG: hypothetical protein ABH950_07365 [Candidatus Altiarchaeota archaeon]